MKSPTLDPGAAASDADPPRATRELQIASEHDRFWAAAEARRFAAAIGFCADCQARIALCVSELASNAAKHAGRGTIGLTELTGPTRGCRVRAEDDGPGIAGIDEALCDGFSEGRWLTPDVPMSERRGLGIGLGAVGRLMSELRVLPRPGGGLMIEAVLRESSARPLEGEMRCPRVRDDDG